MALANGTSSSSVVVSTYDWIFLGCRCWKWWNSEEHSRWPKVQVFPVLIGEVEEIDQTQMAHQSQTSRLTTSKVSEAWLSDPVLRTTLLCWILNGDKGWKRRKRDRAVGQNQHNVKLQAYAKINLRVRWVLWSLCIIVHGSWIRIYWQLDSR